MKLLVVEDEYKTGTYIRQGLTEAGFIVELARNGLDGHHIAMTEDFDLIVLDVMLPNVDGWRILQSLRDAGRRSRRCFRALGPPDFAAARRADQVKVCNVLQAFAAWIVGRCVAIFKQNLDVHQVETCRCEIELASTCANPLLMHRFIAFLLLLWLPLQGTVVLAMATCSDRATAGYTHSEYAGIHQGHSEGADADVATAAFGAVDEGPAGDPASFPHGSHCAVHCAVIVMNAGIARAFASTSGATAPQVAVFIASVPRDPIHRPPIADAA